MKNGLSTYKDKSGQYRWKLTYGGKIVGSATESFDSKRNAVNNFHSVMKGLLKGTNNVHAKGMFIMLGMVSGALFAYLLIEIIRTLHG